MPSIYGLKPSFQNLLRPLTNALARVGISANQITLAAMAVSLATGVVIFLLRSQSALLLLPIVLLVRMALAVMPGFNAPVVVFIVLCSGLTEITGVTGVQIGASRRYDGPMGKSDRAFVFAALGLLLGLNLPIVPVVQCVLWLVLVSLLVTVVNRARRALAEVQGSAAR